LLQERLVPFGCSELPIALATASGRDATVVTVPVY
jgi:hypothetical protein